MFDADQKALDDFEKMLHDLYEHLQQFVKTLDAEKALLEQNKTTELDQSMSAKRLIIESLDKISFQCQSYFSNQSAYSEKGILSIISHFPEGKQLYLTDLWKEIKTLLKTCDKKNLVNGVMITTLKNYNDNMLSIITNRPKESVYGNKYKNNQLAVSTREHKA
ncbi:MAG: flagellar export chaperone FlgN [Candidatus Berkiella sp.]